MLKQVFIPGMFFEDMGITYLGPIDGHNIEALTEVIEDAKQVEGAVLIHVITEKGKGYDGHSFIRNPTMELDHL